MTELTCALIDSNCTNSGELAIAKPTVPDYGVTANTVPAP